MAKTILIIEDEIAIQNIVRAFLEDAGYTVYGAGDGLEGIETFRRCNPDLVLPVWKELRHSGDAIRIWCCWI